MSVTNELEASAPVIAPIALNTPAPNTLSVNVFTAPGKTMVGERPLKTSANPEGLPKSVFDDLQAQLAANRSKFYRDLPEGPFY